jgi:hypothetical protein
VRSGRRRHGNGSAHGWRGVCWWMVGGVFDCEVDATTLGGAGKQSELLSLPVERGRVAVDADVAAAAVGAWGQRAMRCAWPREATKSGPTSEGTQCSGQREREKGGNLDSSGSEFRGLPCIYTSYIETDRRDVVAGGER